MCCCKSAIDSGSAGYSRSAEFGGEALNGGDSEGAIGGRRRGQTDGPRIDLADRFGGQSLVGQQDIPLHENTIVNYSVRSRLVPIFSFFICPAVF